MDLAMRARIGIRRLELWWKLMLLVCREVIRIVYGCLGLSWHVVARWDWITGWVVVAGRIPHRGEVLRVLKSRWVRIGHRS